MKNTLAEFAFSLLPIDVGYDVRGVTATRLPFARKYIVAYIGRNGRDCEISGTRATVTRTLERAGYWIADVSDNPAPCGSRTSWECGDLCPKIEFCTY